MKGDKLFAYVFEARSIQNWILSGGRLADMVAASDLVDQLTGKVIDRILASLGLAEGEDMRIARRAGGAFYAVLNGEEKARSLRDLMSLVIPAFAPGLEFTHCFATGDSPRLALQNALARLLPLRNQPMPALPVAGPLVERETRTGDAAVIEFESGAERKRGPASAATLAKRAAGNGQEGLSTRFVAAEDRRDAAWLWPRNLDAAGEAAGQRESFPFLGEQRQIAIVHADGNGLGQLLLKLGAAVGEAGDADYVALFRDFSDRIERATRLAAQRATAKVLFPAAVEAGTTDGKPCRKLPARPLVLGGDDLSIIVRADLALPFAEEFLRRFSAATRDELAAWHAEPRWAKLFQTPAGAELKRMEHLTACAGISFIKAGQPFEIGYHLAETLCQAAKQHSAALGLADGCRPASLSFYRLTTALAEDLDGLAGSLHLDGLEVPLRLGCYGLEGQLGLASLKALAELAAVFDRYPAVSAGGLRQLLTLMQEDAFEAKHHYARWRQVLGSREPAALQAFDAALAGLGDQAAESGLPLIRNEGRAGACLACPLEDLFDWRAVASPDEALESEA